MVKTTPTNIREATEEDALDCLILFKQFHKESKVPYSWDAKKTQEVFVQTLPLDNFVTLVAEINNEVVGFICAMYSEPFFSSEKISTEVAWFVNKEYRNSTAGFRLMKSYEDWARGKGVKYIGMTYLENVTDLSEVYEKKGYSKAETQYMKEF